MTPKEKANRLVNKFYIEGDMLKESHSYRLAKQCALIAVNEIINSNPNYPEFKENEGTPIRYWEVVKQEIENL